MTLSELQEQVNQTKHPREIQRLMDTVPSEQSKVEMLRTYTGFKMVLLAEIAQLAVIESDCDPALWRQTMGPARRALYERYLPVMESAQRAVELDIELELAERNARLAADGLRTSKLSARAALCSALLAAGAIGWQIWDSSEGSSATVTLSEPVAVAPLQLDQTTVSRIVDALRQAEVDASRDAAPHSVHPAEATPAAAKGKPGS